MRTANVPSERLVYLGSAHANQGRAGKKRHWSLDKYRHISTSDEKESHVQVLLGYIQQLQKSPETHNSGTVFVRRHELSSSSDAIRFKVIFTFRLVSGCDFFFFVFTTYCRHLYLIVAYLDGEYFYRISLLVRLAINQC